MKQLLTLIAALLFFANTMFAQNVANNQSTSMTGGRYEIIASNLVAKNTFKVDKYYGTVYQLVQDKMGRFYGK